MNKFIEPTSGGRNKRFRFVENPLRVIFTAICLLFYCLSQRQPKILVTFLTQVINFIITLYSSCV